MVRVEDQMREGRGIFEVSSSPFYHLPPNPSQPQQPQENFRRSSQLKSNPRLRSFSAFLTQKTLNLWAALTRSPSLLLASSPLLLDELLLLPTPSEDAKPLQDPCFLYKSQGSYRRFFRPYQLFSTSELTSILRPSPRPTPSASSPSLPGPRKLSNVATSPRFRSRHWTKLGKLS